VGKGKIWFDRFSTAGAKTGFERLGDCSSMTISMTDDVIEHKGSQDAVVKTMKKVMRGRTVQVKVTGHEFAIFNMALALMGDTTEYTQAATAVTGEVLTTDAVKGRYYKTAKRQIGSVTVTNNTTMMALVLNTDYTIFDADVGIIFIKADASGVTDGDEIEIDYTPVAITAGDGLARIRGGNTAVIEGQLLFVSDNTAGENKEVLVYRASVSPDGETPYITNEFGAWSLIFEALDDSDGTYGGTALEPYFYEQEIAA
jgi:hypothetical protein